MRLQTRILIHIIDATQFSQATIKHLYLFHKIIKHQFQKIQRGDTPCQGTAAGAISMRRGPADTDPGMLCRARHLHPEPAVDIPFADIRCHSRLRLLDLPGSFGAAEPSRSGRKGLMRAAAA
jgi:hypothetical protein